MTDEFVLTRTADPSDTPALKALWKTVFGDTDADIARFFNIYYSPDRTVIIKDGGIPVSAAYILPAGSLVTPDGARGTCAMLYAIATLPEYRGRGYGAAVTRAAAAAALAQGFSAAVLWVAEDSLLGYYEKHTGFKPFFNAVETEFLPNEWAAEIPDFKITRAEPEAYGQLRRKILTGSVFIDSDRRALSYQQILCDAAGGGLYILENGVHPIGCAVVELEDGTGLVKELLIVNGYTPKQAVSVIAERHPAEKYIVRYPTNVCRSGQEKSRPFGMIFPNHTQFDGNALHCAKWYGPAFD